MIEILNFIDNTFKPSESGKILENKNPATGQVFSSLPRSDALDVVYAIRSAKKAFPQWQDLPVKERAQWLHKIADKIESRFEDFAQAETLDTGKPLWLSRKIDIPRAIENFRFFASRILHFHSDPLTFENTMSYVHHSPVGVCSLICPWNLPLYLLTWKIAPCLVTGNVAICKPSEMTPYTAYLWLK